MSPARRSWGFVLLLLLLSIIATRAQETTSTSTTDTTTTSSTESSSASPTSSTSTTDTSTTTGSSDFPTLTTTTSTSSTASVTTTSDASSTSTGTTIVAGLTNAPTLPGLTIPSLIVPDTSGAPFMQKSNLPEGTVFIFVGAALGFFGACILAWRVLVAWSLQRSVKRAASAQYASESKSKYRPGPFGKAYDDSNVSMENLTSKNTGYRGNGQPTHRKDKKHGISKTPTASSLFFSPTAGATGNMNAPVTRAAGFLPSGYYASGTAAAAAGAAIAHIGGPSAAGYGRVESAENTPPTTPRPMPSPTHRQYNGKDAEQYGGRGGRNGGGGNFGLQMPGERAPSAVLDSWFDHSTAMSRADRQ